MGRKAIILCMSCNQEKYINEENAIKGTWAKDIIDGKYPNISVCFYRGGSEENRYDEEQHILYLTSNDTLNGTFKKTHDAFEWVENNFEDYDFIIRTNLSTYINIEAISQFLKNSESGVDMILTTGLVLNGYNNCIPYPKGHFMIIHKTIVKEIIDIGRNIKVGIDDAVIGTIMAIKYSGEYFNHIREVDGINDIGRQPQSLCELKKCFSIRLKDEENYKNTIMRMYYSHNIFLNIKDEIKIQEPHGFTWIETLCGLIPV